MSDKEPCGNDECDICNPVPRWVVSTESVERRVHRREIKAATPEEALRVYEEGTAWPEDYDTHTTEVLEEEEPQVRTYAEVYPDRVELRARLRSTRCWHNLERLENMADPLWDGEDPLE